MSQPHVIVLTAAPGSGAITKTIVEAAHSALGRKTSAARWLAPGEAWETAFEAAPEEIHSLRDAVQAAISEAPVDVNVVPAAGRRKRLLAADMESTIIEQELIDEIATLVGIHAEISAITAAAMRGDIDFEMSLTRRVALFEGLEIGRLEPLLGSVTLMAGAETLVRTMRDNGATCALISGGFTMFADPIGARLGFDAVVANELEIENGRLTGRVKPPVVGPAGKAAALARLAAEQETALSDTISVGDGANDVAMLSAAGLGVAYRAKPLVARHARALAGGAVVTHGDLTALLYLQGLTPSGREASW